MLNKWWAMKRNLYLRDPDEPPPLVSDCKSLTDCYRWREQIIKEIGEKVSEIQNAGLGEFRVRALNDEINALLNSKRQWEDRIHQLGGQNYRKKEQRFYDADGQELPGSGQYRYFGAAKDLPGVRELFFTSVPLAPARNLKALYRKIPYDYFDFKVEQSKDWGLKGKALDAKKRRKNKFVTENHHILLKMKPDFEQLDEETQKEFIENLDYQKFLELKFLGEVKHVSGLNEDLIKRESEEKRKLEERKKEVLKAFLETEVQPEEPILEEIEEKPELEQLYGDVQENDQTDDASKGN